MFEQVNQAGYQPNFNFGTRQPIANAFGGTGVAPSVVPFSGGVDPNAFAGLSTYGQPQAPDMMGGGFQGVPGAIEPTNLMPQMNPWQKAGIGMQGANMLMQGFMGMKQYGLAKDQLSFQKDAFNKNYGNQVSDYNRRIEMNQEMLNRNTPGSTPVDEYMAKYGRT